MSAQTPGQQAFLNMLKSLHNIDGFDLPELSIDQQLHFMSSPVGYFLRASDEQQDAIWRELAKRQSGSDAQQDRRKALASRIGTFADLLCSDPLDGEKGDVAYDLLRQAAAQISSDAMLAARATPAMEVR